MKKFGYLETVFTIIYILLILSFGVRLFGFNGIQLNTIFFFVILLILLSILVFLSYYDFKKLEVHNIVSFVLMTSLLIINITMFFLDVRYSPTHGFVYLPYDNLMGALILGLGSLLIVLLSKEKALGQGDVRIAIITGLLIGSSNILSWMYITVISSLLYILFIGYKGKRIKGMQIPFVPFMLLGVVLLLLFGL